MMARRRSKNLSERQRRILQVLEDHQNNIGYPPSIREIGEKAGISSTSVVNYYLDQLKEMGYIGRDDRISRGIRLLKSPSTDAPVTAVAGQLPARAASGLREAAQKVKQTIDELLRVPLLGRIAAGLPMPLPSTTDFALFDAESVIEVATSMMPERNTADLFALEVQGDSMIDAMINDGDIVIMKPAKEARNGEMVAVWLNDRDETTLKYFYNEGGRVRLQPANPTMGPIYVDDPKHLRIQGKVVMVIRKVGGLPA
jgi:repressor LexA